MNLMYYVMQYYIICIICLHPIQSRRCIMIIAYTPAPYSVTALHNDHCITAAAHTVAARDQPAAYFACPRLPPLRWPRSAWTTSLMRARVAQARQGAVPAVTAAAYHTLKRV